MKARVKMPLANKLIFLVAVVFFLFVLINYGHCQTASELSRQFPDTPVPQYNGQGYEAARVPDPLINKKFIAAHAIYLAAAIFDTEVTVKGLSAGKCAEKNYGGTRAQMYGKNLGMWAGFTLADVGLRKLHIPLMPYLMAPGYGTYTHIKGATEWWTMGCL